MRDNIMYEAILEATMSAREETDRFIFETIGPFCEGVIHQTISKETLVAALTRYDLLKAESDEKSRIIAELEKKCAGWISVEDRLPEDDPSIIFHDDGFLKFTSVLVQYGPAKLVTIANRLRVLPRGNSLLDMNVTDGFVWSRGTESTTHWQPLPKPTQEDEQ